MTFDIEKEREKLLTYCEILDKYNENLEEDIAISNKKFTEVDAKQIELEMKWRRLYSSICSLHKRCENNSEYEYSKSFIELMDNSRKIVNSTEAKNYALCSDAYQEAKFIENDVYVIKKEIEAITDILETRRFTLKDLTSLVIHDSINRII